MKTTRPDDDRKLLQLLRRGDPADGDPPLAAQDLARMRREILAQVRGGERTTPWIDWRWAAALVCMLVLALGGWQLRDRSVRPSTPPDVAVTREPHSVDETPPPGTVSAPVVDVEEVAVVSENQQAPEPKAPESETAAAPTDADENLQARTLRFTTRRGTQIIWILDPKLEL